MSGYGSGGGGREALKDVPLTSPRYVPLLAIGQDSGRSERKIYGRVSLDLRRGRLQQYKSRGSSVASGQAFHKLKPAGSVGDAVRLDRYQARKRAREGWADLADAMLCRSAETLVC